MGNVTTAEEVQTGIQELRLLLKSSVSLMRNQVNQHEVLGIVLAALKDKTTLNEEALTLEMLSSCLELRDLSAVGGLPSQVNRRFGELKLLAIRQS